MRTLVTVLTILALSGACTGGADSDAEPTPSASALDLAALGVDWPTARAELVPRQRPRAPEGFADEQLDDMATILTDWASAAAVLDSVWHSDDPVPQVVGVLPDRVGTTLRRQVAGSVSPGLAVANVFADDVTIAGDPRVTTAWKVSTDEDEAGRSFVRLELQTRTAYEVRVGDGPTRVIGVLRVHGLSAFADTTDDYGVTGGWQEFGAGDCALALDDVLLPDGDVDETASDLKTFVGIGNGDRLEMPALDVEEQVDAEYLKRCRDGSI